MKVLILLSILILVGCGRQADSQTARDEIARLEKEKQEKAHEHDEHCDHDHEHKH